MRFLVLMLASLISLEALADLKTLDATYVVSAFGADIGESRHSLRCDEGGLCVLEARTHPIGIARLFTSERLQECSEFTIHPVIRWLRYEKKKYDDDRLVRTVTLVREKGAVVYVQGGRTFPAPDNVFDPLSLPFALHQWETPPKLYIQDNNWQDAMTATRWQAPARINDRPARRYTLKGRHVTTDIWLDAETRTIPLRVVVHNHDSNKTITLTLKQERHSTHAPE